MRSRRPVVLRIFGVVLLATIALIGMTPGASAQTICTEEPLLAMVDSNGDGVASTAEIRAVAPGNPELEEAASMLESIGYSGIQYQGCGDSDVLAGGAPGAPGGDTGGTGDTGGEGAGAGETGGGATGAGAEGEATGTDGAPGESGGAAPAITDQERAYFDAVLAGLGEFLAVATAIEELFTEVGDDTDLLQDETWIAEVDDELERWRQIVADAETLEPSERQQHIHATWLSITTLLGLAVDEIDTGLEAQDEAIMTIATDRLTYVTLLLEDLSGSILAFEADPDAPYEMQYALNPVPDCTPFQDYEIAQQYYAAWPEEQPTIDPDEDGLACEVYFGVEEE